MSKPIYEPTPTRQLGTVKTRSRNLERRPVSGIHFSPPDNIATSDAPYFYLKSDDTYLYTDNNWIEMTPGGAGGIFIGDDAGGGGVYIITRGVTGGIYIHDYSNQGTYIQDRGTVGVSPGIFIDGNGSPLHLSGAPIYFSGIPGDLGPHNAGLAAALPALPARYLNFQGYYVPAYNL